MKSEFYDLREFINLTPHPIVFRDGDNEITFQPTGNVARVETESHATKIGGYPVAVTRYLKPSLPPKKRNIVYIVSLVVAQASDRDDLVCPDTGPTCVRDEKGHIQAVTQFVRVDHRRECTACHMVDEIAEQLCYSCCEGILGSE